MPDSGEEDDALLEQAREFLCDTGEEHYILLEDGTIKYYKYSKGEGKARFYVMDGDGSMEESGEDTDYLKSLGRMYFDSSMWSTILD